MLTKSPLRSGRVPDFRSTRVLVPQCVGRVGLLEDLDNQNDGQVARAQRAARYRNAKFGTVKIGSEPDYAPVTWP